MGLLASVLLLSLKWQSAYDNLRTIGMRRIVSIRALLVPSLAMLITGCFAYRSVITVLQDDNNPQHPPVATEVERLQNTVAFAVYQQGMILASNFPAVESESKRDARWDEVVLGLWSTHRIGDGLVRVWLTVDKKTNEVHITIEQLDSPWATNETRAKETALIDAIGKEFPYVETRVEHFTDGPGLPP
jgi:hypothetical protein